MIKKSMYEGESLSDDDNSTRSRILQAVEEVIYQKGFSHVTMREITNRAQVNLASVNYHFGSKDQLIEHMLLRRMQPIMAKRKELLAEAVQKAEENGTTADPRMVLSAYLSPMLELASDDSHMSDIYPKLAHYVTQEQKGKISDRFAGGLRMAIQGTVDVLADVYPSLDEKFIAANLFFMSQNYTAILVSSETASIVLEDEKPLNRVDWEAYHQQVIDFLVNMFEQKSRNAVTS